MTLSDARNDPRQKPSEHTPATASQTAGPYWALIDFPAWADLLRADGPNAGYAEGSRITLAGRITDGQGTPCTDAWVEIWQADPHGNHETGFHGFGRSATNQDGRFHFATVKPGPVKGRGNATQAPHITLTIFARGLTRHLVTRLYFADEPLNDSDPVLNAVPAARRGSLIATPAGANAWNLDIRLQGENETVFLEV